MFTIGQIKTAHAKVQSGADFPDYIQEITAAGVTGYETFVSDGHTLFFGKEDFSIASEAKYAPLTIAGTTDAATFKKELKEHQQGKSGYLFFCESCAKCGIEKWVVDTRKMTCSYFDKAGNEILVEFIPAP